MRLQRLAIKNFRSFGLEDATSFDLDHSVVLLCGGNGSGKSSFFDALELTLTGLVRRFENHVKLSRLLVNARHPNEAASLHLRWTDDLGKQESDVSITSENGASKWLSSLQNNQIHLFQNTTYLLQSDIRRLITSDSASLGEIVEKLIVDDQIDLLIRGLADANISRNDPSYQRAKYEMDQLGLSLETASKGLQVQKSAIASIRETRLPLSEITRKLKSIRRALGLEESDRPVTSLRDVGTAVAELDRSLQKQLRMASETQVSAERGQAQTIALIREHGKLEVNRREMQRAEVNSRAIQERLGRTREEIQSNNKALRRAQSMVSSRSSIPTLIQVLSAASHLQDSDSCPVCDQSFSNLKDHIRSKLIKLNSEQTEIERTVTSIQDRLSEMQKIETELRNSVTHVNEHAELLRQEIETNQRRIQAFISKYEDFFESIPSLKEIESYETARLKNASESFQRLSKVTETMLQLRSDTLAATAGLTQHEGDLNALAVREEALRKTWKTRKGAFDRLEVFIDTTQEARRKLSARVEELMNEFVQGRTKVAFEDMFRRIARHPYFHVTIPVSRVKYHKPEVNWVASYKGQELPGDAVFSQGQLNACALSFFLALATTQPQHLGFLLLDDPVQNMDEVHIEEFANVLKAVKDILGWQLIIAVHEESLFNYLKRILYPSEPGQSLISYRLEAGERGTEIRPTDSYRFDAKVFSLASLDAVWPSR